MYYQNYEDYMRSVLGYPIEPTNTYESYDYLMSPYIGLLILWYAKYVRTIQNQLHVN